MYSSFLNITQMNERIKQNTNSMSLSDYTPLAIFYHHNLLNFNELLQFIATGSDCTGGHH